MFSILTEALRYIEGLVNIGVLVNMVYPHLSLRSYSFGI